MGRPNKDEQDRRSLAKLKELHARALGVDPLLAESSFHNHVAGIDLSQDQLFGRWASFSNGIIPIRATACSRNRSSRPSSSLNPYRNRFSIIHEAIQERDRRLESRYLPPNSSRPTPFLSPLESMMNSGRLPPYTHASPPPPPGSAPSTATNTGPEALPLRRNSSMRTLGASRSERNQNLDHSYVPTLLRRAEYPLSPPISTDILDHAEPVSYPDFAPPYLDPALSHRTRLVPWLQPVSNGHRGGEHALTHPNSNVEIGMPVQEIPQDERDRAADGQRLTENAFNPLDIVVTQTIGSAPSPETTTNLAPNENRPPQPNATVDGLIRSPSNPETTNVDAAPTPAVAITTTDAMVDLAVAMMNDHESDNGTIIPETLGVVLSTRNTTTAAFPSGTDAADSDAWVREYQAANVARYHRPAGNDMDATAAEYWVDVLTAASSGQNYGISQFEPPYHFIETPISGLGRGALASRGGRGAETFLAAASRRRSRSVDFANGPREPTRGLNESNLHPFIDRLERRRRMRPENNEQPSTYDRSQTIRRRTEAIYHRDQELENGSAPRSASGSGSVPDLNGTNQLSASPTRRDTRRDGVVFEFHSPSPPLSPDPLAFAFDGRRLSSIEPSRIEPSASRMIGDFRAFNTNEIRETNSRLETSSPFLERRGGSVPDTRGGSSVRGGRGRGRARRGVGRGSEGRASSQTRISTRAGINNLHMTRSSSSSSSSSTRSRIGVYLDAVRRLLEGLSRITQVALSPSQTMTLAPTTQEIYNTTITGNTNNDTGAALIANDDMATAIRISRVLREIRELSAVFKSLMRMVQHLNNAELGLHAGPSENNGPATSILGQINLLITRANNSMTVSPTTTTSTTAHTITAVASGTPASNLSINFTGVTDVVNRIQAQTEAQPRPQSDPVAESILEAWNKLLNSDYDNGQLMARLNGSMTTIVLREEDIEGIGNALQTAADQIRARIDPEMAEVIELDGDRNDVVDLESSEGDEEMQEVDPLFVNDDDLREDISWMSRGVERRAGERGQRMFLPNIEVVERDEDHDEIRLDHELEPGTGMGMRTGYGMTDPFAYDSENVHTNDTPPSSIWQDYFMTHFEGMIGSSGLGFTNEDRSTERR